MKAHQLINQNSDCVEWYTPKEIIEAARKCLGRIDLDPFSCAEANETVQADKFFTKDDDGFNKDWCGNVWVIHPFSRENNKRIAAKVIDEYLWGCEYCNDQFCCYI